MNTNYNVLVEYINSFPEFYLESIKEDADSAEISIRVKDHDIGCDGSIDLKHIADGSWKERIEPAFHMLRARIEAAS